jgi:nitrogen fixation NifU-like protein
MTASGDLRELYQELILDHHSKPRNFKTLEDADRRSEGNNPLCGDRLTLALKLDQGRIADIGFQGTGCAISRAAASMMTERVRGMRIEEAERIFAEFHRMVAGDGEVLDRERLGKLAVFSGVREFPSRIKCATLAWHALHAALSGGRDVVSTE